MPTLTRLLFFIVLICALIYGVMVGLVAWVEPTVSELTIDIPSSDIKPKPWPQADQTAPLVLQPQQP